MRAYKKEHGSTDGFTTDWDEYLRLYDAYLNDPDGEVRRFAAVLYARPAVLAQRKSALEKIVSLVPYDDPFWSYAPEALVDVYTGLSEEGGDELFAHIERIASERARGIVLISAGMKAMMIGDKQKLAEIYKQLKAGFGNSPEFDYYIRMFDPDQRIAQGREVPAFEVKLIDSDRTVSNRSLLGSYYLMDFWAVWCGPCRAEMPNLHKAWEKYKGASFKILSLSFDPRVSDVEKYRKGEWP
ncbi:MAG TPA: TlpA family protein disulfide reductase, partial [Caldithrix abyssi]|nr:TlpA family protein disulfide reductase [Caldithrix abyssi]